ncbi:MAG: tRNA-intron lyase [Candidatus Aenigmatarchaeota archaeon]
MFEIRFDPRKGIWAEEPEAVEKLIRNWFGELEKGKGRVWLEPEEAMYLMAFQKAQCFMGEKEIGFNELAVHYIDKVPRLLIRYSAYRDWRDRGLIAKNFKEIKGRAAKGHKKYPARALKMRNLKLQALWYPRSMFAVVEKGGRELFEGHWFGQFGVYKQERGELLKLNSFETVFLARHFGLDVADPKGKALRWRGILAQVTRQREWTKQLYGVYEDWRLNGFIVKTGFKFGSHFRIYFPGASPVGEYIHSKHVLHVFPKEQKLLISEWARAVRVAHGVKKTFLLGIPKLKKADMVEYPADFLAYRRRKEKQGWVRETPGDSRPRYMLVAVSEDEHIGGVELASLLHRAQEMGLELILSIIDRESSITYYILKKVALPGVKQEYYEIEWMRP